MIDEEDCRKLVKRFISAYFSWELSAHHRWTNGNVITGNTLTADGQELMTQLRDEYEAKLRPFVAKNIRLRCPGWGCPVRHDPEREEITCIEPQDETYVVRTMMRRQNGSIQMTDIYEYTVNVTDRDAALSGIIWISTCGDRTEMLDQCVG